MSKFYIYEKNTGRCKAVFGVKVSSISDAINHFSFIAEWFLVGFLFYCNSHFIHSRLFSIFVFICGLILMTTIGAKKRISTKKEFLEKVNELIEDKENV